jgi:hypothetical protein
VNPLRDNINTIKKNIETLIDASRKVDLDGNHTQQYYAE